MKLKEAFPGNWLSAADLGEEDHVCIIQDVRSEMIGQGERARLKLVVKFREFEKPLVCNLTNAKTIAALHGDETNDWVGKRITLWVNPDVQFGSEIVSAIRVRSKAPTPLQANGLLNYAAAVDACAKAGISEDSMKQYLRSTGLTAYKAELCTPLVRKLIAATVPPPDPGTLGDDEVDVPF